MEQHSIPRISVVIPTKDRTEILLETLGSVHRSLQNHDYEVIVVNDSEAALSLDFPNTIVIPNAKTGVASGRNTGASAARGELLLLMDDDMIVNEVAVEVLVRFARENSRHLMIPNWTYPPELVTKMSKRSFGRFLQIIGHHTLKGWNKPEDWKSDTQSFEVRGVTSQCLLFRKSEFLEMGGYDDTFQFAGAEDNEFLGRLLANGFKISINPAILIHHNESDRIELQNWLLRKRRQGFTNRQAVEKGIFNPTDYSTAKKGILKLILGISPVVAFASRVAGRCHLDKLQVKLTGALIAANMYAGYEIDFQRFKNGKSS